MVTAVTWTDVVTALATAITAVILAAAGVAAALQYSEARSLRRAQVRPFVVIDFDVESVATIIFMVVKNFGTTMAYEVTFEFDKPVESSLDAEDRNREKIGQLAVFTHGIPTLAPGKEIRFLFDSFIQRKNLPDAYVVTVTYQGQEVRRWLRRRREVFEEKIVLDLGIYHQMGRVDRRGLHDIHDRLKEMLAEMKKWTASGRGLLTLNPDDVGARDEAIIRHWEEDAAERQSQEAAERDEPSA